MTFIIRPAANEDAEALARLLRDLVQFSRINSEPPSATLEHVSRALALCLADNSHSMYVCEDAQGMLIGYGSVHFLPYLLHTGPEGYVSELFVRPGARGQGIGSALLDTMVEEARRRGCERMMLINMRNRESYQREFYKKHGWEERETAANFVLELKDGPG